MFFPIGDDDIIGGHKPIVAYTFLGFNIAVFLFELSLSPAQGEWFFFTYGMQAFEITNGEALYTLLTSMFIHGGWMHLIGNMLFLWIFADNIEAVIGNFGFLIFYILGGLFASIAHIAVNPESIVPSVGASGAISAVMGAYLVMFPKSRVKVLILIFFITFEISAFAFLGIWFVQQLVSGVGAIGISTQDAGGIAWWAHIGGFAYGIVMGIILRKLYGHRYRYGGVKV